jgi:hypothetical protein
MNNQQNIDMNFHPIFMRDRLVLPECKQSMMSLRAQASRAKMASLRGKLTAPDAT